MLYSTGDAGRTPTAPSTHSAQCSTKYERVSTVSDDANIAPRAQQHEALPRGELLRLYRTMLLSRPLNDKEIQL